MLIYPKWKHYDETNLQLKINNQNIELIHGQMSDGSSSAKFFAPLRIKNIILPTHT